MNEIMKQLIERKSVRAFEDREIDENIVQDILKAAIMAPTAGNQQLYTILRITDQEILDQLSRSCDNQPFIAKGKLVLLFLADCLKWYNAYIEAGSAPRSPDVGDLMLAVSDANIAAQNAVTAAESMGIGSCYIGDIMENIETQQEILSLPKYVFPAVMVVFGYPTDQQKARKKPDRFDLKYIVNENSYHELNGEELREMFTARVGTHSYEDWITAFCERKYNSDFSREMSRSVRKVLDSFFENK